MVKQDYDKTKQLIEDTIEVYQDVEKKLADDGKISWVEGSSLVIAHGLKAVRTISSIKEIGQEIVDTDDQEAAESAQLLIDHFGGTEEAKEAIILISEGAGKINQGIQKLIAIRKTKQVE